MHHACQEGGLVLQVSYAKTLQSSDADTANASCCTVRLSPLRFPLQTHVVPTRQTQLTDVGYDDECTSEDTFISGFGTLD